MTVIYVETSALVKRYMPEAGSELLDALFEQRQRGELIVTSILSLLEFKSALKRLVKGGKLREPRMTRALADFREERGTFSLVLPLDTAIVEEAAALIDHHMLRAADSIHLASALRAARQRASSATPLIFLTSDAELKVACHEEGIRFLDPEDSDALTTLGTLR